MALTAGTRLGPYEITAMRGAGGMGEVYKAIDTRLDRTVAVKVLSPHLATDPQFRERFDREAKTISQLNHRNICALYDVGEHQGTACLVMEYLQGETLAQKLAGSGLKARGSSGLPLPDALKIATEIASALDAAHRAGITHRDLKPGNVMLTRSGSKLLDFGLAKARGPARVGSGLQTGPGQSALPTVAPEMSLTAQGTILGTFQYMAPEQVEGLDADARTDIFAFGAVVFEIATGRKAFQYTAWRRQAGSPPLSRRLIQVKRRIGTPPSSRTAATSYILFKGPSLASTLERSTRRTAYASLTRFRWRSTPNRAI